ncbi:MAG: hypothetical protein SGPRY_005106 [Prymnesium sp.]
MQILAQRVGQLLNLGAPLSSAEELSVRCGALEQELQVCRGHLADERLARHKLEVELSRKQVASPRPPQSEEEFTALSACHTVRKERKEEKRGRQLEIVTRAASPDALRPIPVEDVLQRQLSLSFVDVKSEADDVPGLLRGHSLSTRGELFGGHSSQAETSNALGAAMESMDALTKVMAERNRNFLRLEEEVSALLLQAAIPRHHTPHSTHVHSTRAYCTLHRIRASSSAGGSQEISVQTEVANKLDDHQRAASTAMQEEIAMRQQAQVLHAASSELMQAARPLCLAHAPLRTAQSSN